MCIARIENGKIAEAWNNFDFLSMYQQLGMQLS
jgi:predicted ester cyclase